MSYEIVKSIAIKKGKVFTRMSSNNVYPKDFTSQEHKYLTQILEEKGLIYLYTFLVEGGLEGSLDFKENGNKIVRQLNFVVNDLYNDKHYQNKNNTDRELSRKIWGTKEGSKEREVYEKEFEKNKLELNDYIKLKVREYFEPKIKIPYSIKRELDNIIEMYQEDLENEESDVFSGTQDSYANEMLLQNIYDVLSKENIEKIMALNHNLYIVLDLNYINKSYNDVLNEITEKLVKKIEYHIENLEKFINVIKDENEMEEINECSIS